MQNQLPPKDFQNPDFDNCRKVHDWKNHVSDEIAELWATFTDTQKAALARQAQYASDCEEWE